MSHGPNGTQIRRKMPREQREKTLEELASLLTQEQDVIFAYAHGSFLKAERFADLDVAIYFSDELTEKEQLKASLRLATQLSKQLQLPVDARPLNSAALGFCFAAVQGRMLTSSDERLRVDYVKRILLEYFDFRPILRRSVRRLMTRGTN